MFFYTLKRGNNDLMAYIGTIVLVMMGYSIVGSIPIFLLQYYKLSTDPSLGTEEFDNFLRTVNFEYINVDRNTGLVFMLLIFVFALLGLYLGVKYLHKVPFRGLITSKKSIDVGKILYGCCLWSVLLLIGEGIAYASDPSAYTWIFEPGPFLVLVLICLLLLPIQTSTEELFFRGYLMPAISYSFNNKWIPLIITTILFGSVHLTNPEVSKFGTGIMITHYMSAGLFLGLITVLDDSLELALGVHFATNFLTATLVAYEGSVLQTYALFSVSETNPYFTTFAFIISGIIFTWICFRKYSWSWRTLFQPIRKNNVV